MIMDFLPPPPPYYPPSIFLMHGDPKQKPYWKRSPYYYKLQHECRMERGGA
jgi:hypothetical protein